MPGWVGGSGCRCLCECYSTFVTRYTMPANSRTRSYVIYWPRGQGGGFESEVIVRWFNHYHWPLIRKSFVFLPFCYKSVHCTLTWHLDSSNVWWRVNMFGTSVTSGGIIKTKQQYLTQLEDLVNMINYSLFHANKSQEARFKHPCVVGYDNRYLDVVNCINTMWLAVELSDHESKIWMSNNRTILRWIPRKIWGRIRVTVMPSFYVYTPSLWRKNCISWWRSAMTFSAWLIPSKDPRYIWRRMLAGGRAQEVLMIARTV